MRLTSVRLRWACNSSSTHSAVLFRSLPRPVSPNDGDGYGWSNFTLTSREDKLRYISAQLYNSVGEAHYKSVFLELFPELVFWRDENSVPLIDHQSMWHGVGEVPAKMLAETLDLLLQPDVAILGGNDNFEGHPAAESIDALASLGRSPFSSLGRTMRYSEVRKEWTFLQTKTGAKIRIAAEGSDLSQKPEAPELVDMKITDYCTFGCKYCYQGSTAAGTHVPADAIMEAWTRLEAEGVLEVALGGGEPTLHPDWDRLAAFISASKMRFAVTTRNFVSPVDLSAMAIAGSVDSVADAQRFLRAMASRSEYRFRIATPGETPEEALRLDQEYSSEVSSFLASSTDERILRVRSGHNRFSIQIVVGAHPEATLRDVVRFCKTHNVPLTLLGWKATGRAKGTRQPPYAVDWARIVEEEALGLVGVDTALVQRHRALFRERVPSMLYHTNEGMFSAALSWSATKEEWSLSPSSYSSTSVAVNVSDGTAWAEAWRSLPVEENMALEVDPLLLEDALFS